MWCRLTAEQRASKFHSIAGPVLPGDVATSGGHRIGDRTRVTFDALVHHAIDLSGVYGRRPRIMYRHRHRRY